MNVCKTTHVIALSVLIFFIELKNMNEWITIHKEISLIINHISKTLIENINTTNRRNSYEEYIYTNINSEKNDLSKKVEYTFSQLDRFILVFKEFKKIIDAINCELVPKDDLKFILKVLTDLFQLENDKLKFYIEIDNKNNLLDKIFKLITPYANINNNIYLESIAIYEKLKSYENQIKYKENRIKELDSVYNKTKIEARKISNMHQEIQDLYREYYAVNENNIVPMATTLDTLSQDIKDKYSEVHDFYQRLITDEDSIRQQILSGRDIIRSREADLDKSLARLDHEIIKISSFHREIYGDSETNYGIKKDIEDRSMQLTAFEEEHKLKYEAISEQVESLLPGATSAGLAKSYHDQKDKYDESITHNTYIFYGIIAVMFLASFVISTSDISFFPPSIEFVKINNIEDISSFLFFRLPVLLPLIWLAVFVSRRRSECERLKQEYTHKAALASSYESFKQQIKDIDGDKADVLMEKLLDSAINAISHNASLTLDKKADESIPIIGIVEKTVDKVLEKMPSKNKED